MHTCTYMDVQNTYAHTPNIHIKKKILVVFTCAGKKCFVKCRYGVVVGQKGGTSSTPAYSDFSWWYCNKPANVPLSFWGPIRSQYLPKKSLPTDNYFFVKDIPITLSLPFVLFILFPHICAIFLTPGKTVHILSFQGLNMAS